MAKPKTDFNPDGTFKPGVHSTGHPNLYLLVSTVGNNARSWCFRYQWLKQTKVIGLGPTHSISFAAAQAEALKLRIWLLHKKDPRAEWNKERIAGIAKPTFDQCAKDYHAAMSGQWKNPKHVNEWITSVTTHASPHIGALAIDTIGTEHVLKVLQPIWATKTTTADRVRGRIEAVLSWAKTKKLRSGDNPAAWKNHLDNVLAAPSKIAKVKNFPSLPWRQLPAFMAALRRQEGDHARALELLILTATRSNEAREACWSEFDLDNAVWTVPAGRMKGGVEHEIPLSAPALELLRNLPRHASTDLLFPAATGVPIKDMRFSRLLKKMNTPKVIWIDPKDGRAAVTHGFRSTFRVWFAESTNFQREMGEHALAHTLGDATERAYQRSTMFPKRIRLMDEWAAWATSTPGSVVPLRSAQAA